MLSRGVQAVKAGGDELSPDQAVVAALAVFESEGLAGVTLRSVAQRAGVPPATIQRRFQTKQRLIRDVMAAFVEGEVARMAELSRKLGGRLAPLGVLPNLLCAELDAPGQRTRRVMMIEFLLAAARDADLRPLANAWFDAMEASWAAVVGDAAHAGSLAVFMVELHVALALDSIGCEGDLERRLANIEVAQFALLGAGASERFWFQALLGAAAAEQRAYPKAITGADARAILDAGSDILVASGSEAISFRSVAAQAGVTFSMVASTFRRKEILLSSICDHLVARAMTIAPPPLEGPRDLAKICEITCDMLTAGGRFYGKYFFLGAVELRMLAARNAEFSHLAWRLRMMNGLYELRKDDPTFEAFSLQSFAVHARACWAGGAGLIQAAMRPPEALHAALLARLKAGAPCFEVTPPIPA